MFLVVGRPFVAVAVVVRIGPRPGAADSGNLIPPPPAGSGFRMPTDPSAVGTTDLQRGINRERMKRDSLRPLCFGVQSQCEDFNAYLPF